LNLHFRKLLGQNECCFSSGNDLLPETPGPVSGRVARPKQGGGTDLRASAGIVAMRHGAESKPKIARELRNGSCSTLILK